MGSRPAPSGKGCFPATCCAPGTPECLRLADLHATPGRVADALRQPPLFLTPCLWWSMRVNPQPLVYRGGAAAMYWCGRVNQQAMAKPGLEGTTLGLEPHHQAMMQVRMRWRQASTLQHAWGKGGGFGAAGSP
jgi:hypothetical protein